jgi:hypothetical protein
MKEMWSKKRRRSKTIWIWYSLSNELYFL